MIRDRHPNRLLPIGHRRSVHVSSVNHQVNYGKALGDKVTLTETENLSGGKNRLTEDECCYSLGSTVWIGRKDKSYDVVGTGLISEEIGVRSTWSGLE